MDSNRDAPVWLIDEDYTLLQLVRMFLGPTGAINWSLVADALNASVSFTGHVRSKVQCRDRYFRAVMPREDGRGDDDRSGAHAVSTKKKKSKHSDSVHPNLPGTVSSTSKSSKHKSHHATTQKMMEENKYRALLGFHSSCFDAVKKAVTLTRKPMKQRRFDKDPTHDQLANSVVVPPTGPFTPAQLSERRLHKEKTLQEKQLAGQLHLQQQRQRGHAMHARHPAYGVGSATGSGGAMAASAALQQQQWAQGARTLAASGRKGSVGSLPAVAGAGASPHLQYAKQAYASSGVGTPSAERLVTAALAHFTAPEARRALMSVYRNPQITEAIKVHAFITAVVDYGVRPCCPVCSGIDIECSVIVDTCWIDTGSFSRVGDHVWC